MKSKSSLNSKKLVFKKIEIAQLHKIYGGNAGDSPDDPGTQSGINTCTITIGNQQFY